MDKNDQAQHQQSGSDNGLYYFDPDYEMVVK